MSSDRQTLDELAGQLRRSSLWGKHEAWDKHELYTDGLHNLIFHLLDEVKQLQEKVIELESKAAHLPSHMDIEI